MGTESRSPRDRANLYHTSSQVTQRPSEQLPQTQKGISDPTWAENSIPQNSSCQIISRQPVLVPRELFLGILAPLSIPTRSSAVWQGSLPAAPPVLSLVDKGVWEQKSCAPNHPHFHPHTMAPTKPLWEKLGQTPLRLSGGSSGRKGAGGTEAVRLPKLRPGASLPSGSHTRCQKPSAAKAPAPRTNQYAGVTGMSNHWLILQP